MRKINLFIDKNPELISIIIGIIGFVVIGIIYDSLYTMFKIFLGTIAFGVFIGLIFGLIKIFSK